MRGKRFYLPGSPQFVGLPGIGLAFPASGSAPRNTVLPSKPTGTIGQGNLLTSPDTGTWIGAPTPTYARQWFRAEPTYSGGNLVTSGGDIVYTGPEDIAGETGATYTQTYSDDGKVIGVRVTATNALGAVSATSFVTTPIYGPELLANPNFDDSTIWTLGTNLSIGSGLLTAASAGATRSATQAVVLSAGTTYRSLIEITAQSGGDVGDMIADDGNGTNGTPLVTRNTVGVHTQSWAAAAGNDTYRLRFSSAAILSLTRASLRRVL